MPLGPPRPPYCLRCLLEPLRSRNLTFAVGRGQRLAFLEAVIVRSFREAYRSALLLWRAGARKIAFPFGTWLMERLHCVATEAG